MKRLVRDLLRVLAAMAFVFFVSFWMNEGTTADTVYAEEIDSSVDYSECYDVSDQEITIKEGYTKTNIRNILNAALVEARDMATAEKPVTVKVPAGTYYLKKNLRIFSNTTLDLTGVTLKYTGKESHVMLMTGTNGAYMGESDYNNSKKCAGYNGFENITIKGGTFVSKTSNTSTIIRIAHAKNVTLDGVTLKGGGCAHQSEVAAINGFYVRNCSFLDWDGAGEGKKYEALQLDIPCSSKVFKAVYQDNTVMKNVEITGCTFANVPRGVGTHTFLVGAYHENIIISSNTFQNVKEEAIVCTGYKNTRITDNKIIDCGGGILFQYFKSSTSSVYSTVMDGQIYAAGKVEHDANSVISGNDITIIYTGKSDEVQGIKLYGRNLETDTAGRDGRTLTAQNYYVSGVTVTGNTIVTAGYGIHLMDAEDCTITNNTITGEDFDSSDPWSENYDGIFLTDESSANRISSNIISGMTGCGINLYNSSKVSGGISSNTIRECEGGGIRICNSSEVTGNISENKVANVEKDGIMVLKGAKVAGGIEKNKITSAGGCGIYIYDESGMATVAEIKNNTIKAAGSYGIDLESTQNNVLISRNKVSGCKDDCLMIQSSSTLYTITVSYNTVQGKKAKDSAINIAKGCVYVTGNTLFNARYGVNIAEGVKGMIGLNNYEDGISKQIDLAGKTFKQTKTIKM